MDLKSADVAIVGGGQAGLALSYHLTAQDRDHVILEQGRVVESWRTKRWDSLRLIAPNWSLVLPGFMYRGDDPDGFMGKIEVVSHLERYAKTFSAPVCEGVRVVRVEHDRTGDGFLIETEQGELAAKNVVVATGALQRPRRADFAGAIPTRVMQLVASDYRRPDALPPGKILIVGSGETGVQIAEELSRVGRDVFLSGGRSWWSPRRYRGRDIAAWMRLLGWFERLASDLPEGVRTGRPNPQLTGAAGGHDISPHTLTRDGVTLVGRLSGIDDGIAFFAPDLAANVRSGDEQALAFLRSIDRIVDEQQLRVPGPELPDDLNISGGERQTAAEHRYGSARTELPLTSEGISVVIWATGYLPDLDWVRLPFLDGDGYPIQRRGVTRIPGLYVLGLDWLHTAKSGLFAGIGDDAGYVAAAISARA